MIIKAICVAAFVGSVLLVINQYGAVFGPEKIHFIPAILTYCVPFLVFIGGELSAKSDRK